MWRSLTTISNHPGRTMDFWVGDQKQLQQKPLQLGRKLPTIDFQRARDPKVDSQRFPTGSHPLDTWCKRARDINSRRFFFPTVEQCSKPWLLL